LPAYEIIVYSFHLAFIPQLTTLLVVHHIPMPRGYTRELFYCYFVNFVAIFKKLFQLVYCCLMAKVILFFSYYSLLVKLNLAVWCYIRP